MPVAMGEARRAGRSSGLKERRNGRAAYVVKTSHSVGDEGSHSSAVVRTSGLSPAEREVVRSLARGLSPKEVASDRGTSIATVRTQIKRAKKKSMARTLNELVALICMADVADQPQGEPVNAVG